MASSTTTTGKTLASALLVVQQQRPALKKDREGAHGAKYISLDSLLSEILPLLNANGIILTQHPTHVDGTPALYTRLLHEPSGESEESTMLLMAVKDDPQAQGSAITYARRYALVTALGLTADEDDDGARASNGGRRRVEGEVDAAKLDRPITENQRKVIFGRARGYNIDYAWLPRIIRYSTKGRIANADAVETHGQLDYVLGQLLAFSKAPGEAMAAIEAWEQEQEAAAPQAAAEDFTGDAGAPPFAGSGGDDDIPFAASIA